MATCESLSGRCMACGHGPILVRWDEGGGYAWWEACPACGLTLTTGEGDWPEEGPQAAEAIFSGYGVGEQARQRGLDPRLVWYAYSLIQEALYDPAAPAPRLILPAEAYLEQHRKRGIRVYRPGDVGEAVLELLEEEDRQRFRVLFPQ